MKTKVLFLIEKDSETEVFAYFPDEPYHGHKTPLHINMAYSHVGQHAPCHADYAIQCATASLSQYSALRLELENEGYDLEIINP